MAHIIDYTEFTRHDLIELIESLFMGKIEDITEKIDGVNIQVTKVKGNPVFIRNKTDLNSEQGGMTASDMAAKWASKPEVAKTYLDAANIIETVFANIPDSFFNPDEKTRRVLNAECVVAGKTNIIPYASAQVSFHDIWIYERVGDTWVKKEVTKKGLDVIEKACERLDNARLTPKVIIDITKESNAYKDKFVKKLEKIMKDSSQTISKWQFERFADWAKKEGMEASLIIELFKRWFEGDKILNIRKLKTLYPNIDITSYEDSAKDVVRDINQPLDDFFLELGNAIINLCKNLLNDGCRDSVTTTLKNDLESATKDIQKSGSNEMQSMLNFQLGRLSRIGGQVNPAEGIVFSYKGKLMKLTGSFAPLNRILGDWKYKL